MRSVRRLLSPIVLVSATLGVACGVPASQGDSSRTLEPNLACSLSAPSVVGSGGSVDVRFVLENNGDRLVFVLTWYTPLEGIYGNIFRVFRDDESVKYRGPLARRGVPVRDSYVVVEAGQQVSKVVDLRKGYDMSQAGIYRVEFVGKLHDVATRESSIPRSVDKFRPLNIKCQPGDLSITVQS